MGRGIGRRLVEMAFDELEEDFPMSMMVGRLSTTFWIGSTNVKCARFRGAMDNIAVCVARMTCRVDDSN